jgi:hypothetical protein
MTVRGAERAAQNGGAKRRPRRTTAVDPELATRAQAAAERLTGMKARVTRNTLEIRFDDETALAELVEALETAA